MPFRRTTRINNDTLYTPPEPGIAVVFIAPQGVWYRTYWPIGKPFPENVRRREDYEASGRRWLDLPVLPGHIY